MNCLLLENNRQHSNIYIIGTLSLVVAVSTMQPQLLTPVCAVSDTGTSLPDDLKVVFMSTSCHSRVLSIASNAHSLLHTDHAFCWQVLKLIFSHLFSKGADSLWDQEVLVRSTGEACL